MQQPNQYMLCNSNHIWLIESMSNGQRMGALPFLQDPAGTRCGDRVPGLNSLGQGTGGSMTGRQQGYVSQSFDLDHAHTHLGSNLLDHCDALDTADGHSVASCKTGSGSRSSIMSVADDRYMCVYSLVHEIPGCLAHGFWLLLADGGHGHSY